MNFQAKIQEAINLGTTGRFVELEILCRRLLRKKPRNFDALQFLGAALSKQGKLDQALSVLKKAAAMRPAHAGVRTNLGYAYLAMKQFEKAVDELHIAIRLDPDDGDAHNNLGNAFYNLRRYQEAEEAYLRALHLSPHSVLTAVNLGTCLRRQGFLHEATERYLQANELDPLHAAVYTHLFDVLMLRHATQDADHVLEVGLSVEPLTATERMLFLTSRAIIAWLTGRLDAARRFLDETGPIVVDDEGNPAMSQVFEFHHYLTLLLQKRRTCPELYRGEPDSALFFVAESHCLTPSEIVIHYRERQHRILSSIIMGCKAWHLGHRQPNEYKSSLTALFRALPEGSSIILGFGEIDCRSDEGILPAHLTKGIDFETAIPALVERYVHFTHELAALNRHQLIFYGVPAPCPRVLARLTPELQGLLIDVIRRFNHALRHCCEKRLLDMLDVYTATDDGAGRGNEKFHLDAHHLQPIITPALFDSYLISFAKS